MANVTINQLTAIDDANLADELALYDVSANSTKKVTISSIKGLTNSYTGGNGITITGQSIASNNSNLINGSSTGSLRTSNATAASNSYAFAQGQNTTASGQASHAAGTSSSASGNSSYAGGTGTLAQGNSQTAIGKYNVGDQTSLFIVGNGSSAQRSNALALDQSGNLEIAGNLTMESASGARILSIKDANDNQINFGINEAGTTEGIFDASSQKWILGHNISQNLTYIQSDGLILGNHTSRIGSLIIQSNSSAISVPNQTPTRLISITLPTGVWIIQCHVAFPANATGIRRANLSSTSGSNSDFMQVPALPSNFRTPIHFTHMANITADSYTYYLNAQHTAGTTLSITAQSCQIRAIRIV